MPVFETVFRNILFEEILLLLFREVFFIFLFIKTLLNINLGRILHSSFEVLKPDIFLTDGPSTNSPLEVINRSSGDPPMSPNRHEVRAQVHSPPVISNDDMLKSWAPTSPLRAHSVSAESLMSRKTVAFDKVTSD